MKKGRGLYTLLVPSREEPLPKNEDLAGLIDRIPRNRIRVGIEGVWRHDGAFQAVEHALEQQLGAITPSDLEGHAGLSRTFEQDFKAELSPRFSSVLAVRFGVRPGGGPVATVGNDRFSRTILTIAIEGDKATIAESTVTALPPVVEALAISGRSMNPPARRPRFSASDE